MTDTRRDKFDVLKHRFGHKAFRPLQEEAVDTIVAGKDLLMILPTGGGKSLSYQLPALLMAGTTVVVSPLLALMHDQVQSLKAQGMRAEMLSSMQTGEESGDIIRRIYAGEVDFLYLSPERLNTDGIRTILSNIRLNYFVIDEAHCISEWGHEFRADYRALSMLRDLFPGIAIAAFTATATAHVREDILRLLRLNDANVLQGKIYRDNLQITVRHRVKDGYDQLRDFLEDRKEESGIVYAFSRKSVEAVAHFLQQRGFAAAAYHAGMPSEQRNAVFHDFVHDKVKIIVATIAFGMGIDKSNIRYVFHMSLPKTVENYYQEIGRAGRDGDHADVVMLFGAQDMIQQKRFIEMNDDENYKAHLLQKLGAVHRYASSETCRHQQLAEYFGDRIDPCETHCDNCLEPEYDKRDITTEAQMLLSCVYRTGQRFGKSYLVDVLRGSREQKILANGHDELTVYGVGEAMNKKQWLVIIDRMLELGTVDVNEHHGLFLTQTGLSVLKGEEKVLIRADRLDVRAKTVKKAAPESFDYDAELYETLRALRFELAQEHGVPPYIVFGDKTLKEMAARRPQNKEQMLDVNGIGEVKFERYGAPFLSLLQTVGG
jgi:ATP-dependent DNA helicase RecQ